LTCFPNGRGRALQPRPSFTLVAPRFSDSHNPSFLHLFFFFSAGRPPSLPFGRRVAFSTVQDARWFNSLRNVCVIFPPSRPTRPSCFFWDVCGCLFSTPSSPPPAARSHAPCRGVVVWTMSRRRPATSLSCSPSLVRFSSAFFSVFCVPPDLALTLPACQLFSYLHGRPE